MKVPLLPLTEREREREREFARQCAETVTTDDSQIDIEFEHAGSKYRGPESYRIDVKMPSTEFQYNAYKYLGARRLFSTRPLWVIEVFSRWLVQLKPGDEWYDDELDDEDNVDWETELHGYAGSTTHEGAWQQVFDYLTDKGTSYRNELEVISTVRF